MMKNKPMPSIGITTTKISASLPPMMNDMTTAKMSIRGLRIATRMSIMYAFCTLLTSVVRRVTREEEEKWSMFSNEKD